MPELMFVVKSLVLAVIVAIGLQMKVGPASLEAHANDWIQNSSIAQNVQKVASGAVLVIRNGAKSVSDFVSQTFGNETVSQRASRLNFDFKRSPQSEKEHEDRD